MFEGSIQEAWLIWGRLALPFIDRRRDGKGAETTPRFLRISFSNSLRLHRSPRHWDR